MNESEITECAVIGKKDGMVAVEFIEYRRVYG